MDDDIVKQKKKIRSYPKLDRLLLLLLLLPLPRQRWAQRQRKRTDGGIRIERKVVQRQRQTVCSFSSNGNFGKFCFFLDYFCLFYFLLCKKNFAPPGRTVLTNLPLMRKKLLLCRVLWKQLPQTRVRSPASWQFLILFYLVFMENTIFPKLDLDPH